MMSMIDGKLLKCFAAAVFDGAGAGAEMLKECTAEELRAVLERGEELGLNGFFYYYFLKSGVLPEEYIEKMQTVFRRCSADELAGSVQRNAIAKVCRENNLRYVPLKGWFMCRLYPVPALRVMSDLDILLSTADGRKLWDILKAAKYRENEYSLTLHHYPMLAPPHGRHCKGLEIHHQLQAKYMLGKDEGEVIDDAVFEQGETEGMLHPALTLGMIMEHAWNSHWRQAGLKVLTDALFLLRRFKISRSDYLKFKEKYRFVAEPEWLFGAFPEIFERLREQLPGWNIDTAEEHAAALRLLLLNNRTIVAEGHHIAVRSGFAGKSPLEKLRFLIKSCMLPARTIRYKYKLDPRAKWSLPYYYFLDYRDKAATFFRALRRSGGGQVESALSGSAASGGDISEKLAKAVELMNRVK